MGSVVPGGGISATQTRCFDPEKFWRIDFDQRGCGQSTPFASLKNNTTQDLISDIERLRTHLGVEKWMVAGGSWGTTLSLTYAIHHSSRVRALALRAVFLARKRDADWLYQDGARRFLPEAWQEYESFIPEDERGDLIGAYVKRINSGDEDLANEAATRVANFEANTLSLLPDPTMFDDSTRPTVALALGRLEMHYIANGCFLPSDNWIVENAPTIAQIPVEIVHGRYDLCCPIEQAYLLHEALGDSARLSVVLDASHAAKEPGIVDGIRRAGERLADRLGDYVCPPGRR